MSLARDNYIDQDSLFYLIEVHWIHHLRIKEVKSVSQKIKKPTKALDWIINDISEGKGRTSYSERSAL